MLRALAKRPADRFASAAEMRAALLDGHGSARWPRGRARRAASTALALVALVALAVGGYRAIHARAPAPPPAPRANPSPTRTLDAAVRGPRIVGRAPDARRAVEIVPDAGAPTAPAGPAHAAPAQRPRQRAPRQRVDRRLGLEHNPYRPRPAADASPRR